MRKIQPKRLAPATLVALLSLPAAALAQSPQAPIPAPQGAPPAVSSPMAGHPVAGKNAEERVENRINELHAQLRITPAERPQWDQFADMMRKNARDMDQIVIQRAQQFQSMNALQNMQSYGQITQAHAQHVQNLVASFQALYDTMPDQQKRLADQVFRANSEQHQQSGIQSHHGPNG